MNLRKGSGVVLLCMCAAALGGCSNILQGRDAELLGNWHDEQNGDDYTFTNAEMTILTDGYTIRADYGVDASVTPHQFDMKIKNVTGGDDAETINAIVNFLRFSGIVVLQGLYEIDGDQLRLVVAPKFLGRPEVIPASQDDLLNALLIEATRVIEQR